MNFEGRQMLIFLFVLCAHAALHWQIIISCLFISWNITVNCFIFSSRGGQCISKVHVSVHTCVHTNHTLEPIFFYSQFKSIQRVDFSTAIKLYYMRLRHSSRVSPAISFTLKSTVLSSRHSTTVLHIALNDFLIYLLIGDYLYFPVQHFSLTRWSESINI